MEIRKNIKILYEAFITLCENNEKSHDSCSVCPMCKTLCFNGEKGLAFAESLKRIRKVIGMD